MAVYKVPQDVEAEDKLIGPFSFRQFIYLIIAALGIGASILFYRIFPGLVVIPLPIVVLFLVIALPLRKDQPMETYLLAIVRFYLKPHNRLWKTDGTPSYVEIVAPKVVQERLTKDLSRDEAQSKLDYLARIMDSRGWAAKGVDAPGDALKDEINAEAASTSDIMDEHADLAKSFDALIAQKNMQNRQVAVERMQQSMARAAARQASPQSGAPQTAQQIANAPAQQPMPAVATAPSQAAATGPAQQPPQSAPTAAADDNFAADMNVHFNPYPNDMHQQMIRPIEDLPPDQPVPAATTATNDDDSKDSTETARKEPVSPDIIRLANNNDLSVSALANEAHRLADQGNQEVVISLR